MSAFVIAANFRRLILVTVVLALGACDSVDPDLLWNIVAQWVVGYAPVALDPFVSTT